MDTGVTMVTQVSYEKMLACRNRADVLSVFRQAFPNGMGVEIGVLEGAFSKSILDSWGGFLIGVDPWDSQPASDYDRADVNAITDTKTWERRVQTALAVYQDFSERSMVIRAYSESASRLFRDCSFDFVYIDGNHQQCFKDIVAWWPKVKRDGLLWGHDFNGPRVARAAKVFTEAIGYGFDVVGDNWLIWKKDGEPDRNCQWVRKMAGQQMDLRCLEKHSVFETIMEVGGTNVTEA